MTFNKQHLRNCLRTLKKARRIRVVEDRANSLGYNWSHKWNGKLVDYSIKSFPDWAMCRLTLKIKEFVTEEEIELDIPYDSEIKYGDIRYGEPYVIDYIDSGPHQYIIFKKLF